MPENLGHDSNWHASVKLPRYVLVGATRRSDPDRHDEKNPAITVGRHWMIMWPFDPKAAGPPTTHKATGAYIMWAGSP